MIGLYASTLEVPEDVGSARAGSACRSCRGYISVLLALLIPDQVLRVSGVTVGLGVCLERAQ
jgi:hypothetical protein